VGEGEHGATLVEEGRAKVDEAIRILNETKQPTGGATDEPTDGATPSAEETPSQ